jgi:signal transduction histidine kinase
MKIERQLYQRATDAIIKLVAPSEKTGTSIEDGIQAILSLPEFKSKIDKVKLLFEIEEKLKETPFRAKSHILSLLGDELIGSDNLAIFELVKNSYDADAEVVTVTLENLNSNTQRIIIEDNGTGMSPEVLKNVWLEIGTDFKRGGKRKPSDKYGRISLGEKGVGRLAVHKLGKEITLETQAEKQNFTSRIKFNWQKLIEESNYIQEVSVKIEKIEPPIFVGNTGTRIIISDLKKKTWSRGDLRDLARKVYSIKSPFKSIDSFDVVLKANDHHQSWFDDIKDTKEILKDCLYYFDFKLTRTKKGKFAEFTWNYDFKPPKKFGIKKNKLSHNDFKSKTLNYNTLGINSSQLEELFAKDQKNLANLDLDGIGDIEGRFYVFNLLGPVLKAFGQSNTIKSHLRENSGVRIFRDGIRVYNYGEPSDDWLGLDLSRIQKLGEHFSKNTVVGTIDIELKDSESGLKEKTNREGFDENIFYKKFQFISSSIFEFFERQAQPDRELIKSYLKGVKPARTVGLSESIESLEKKLKEKKVLKEVEPLLKRVQKDYNDMRDVMVNSGMSGLNLGIVFHEVDREIKFLNKEINNDFEVDAIKNRVKNLIELLENFSPILKQNKYITISASDLVKKSKGINFPRFNYHEIIFSSPLISKESPDFNISGPANLLISALSNIIDNSIYWLDSKKELKGKKYKPAILITSDFDNFNAPTILLADNGPGFNISPEDLTMPFRTTRPGGMGLGLYFVSIVMEMLGGQLLFPDHNDVNIPKAYDGALVALVFPKETKS